MPLTLNQALFLVLTFAAVVAAVFLVRLFAQLRRTAAQAEKSLAELETLGRNLNELDGLVKQRVEDLGKTMEAAKKAAVNVSEASFLVTTRIIRPSAAYIPFLIPAARWAWRRFRKRKE